jgi:hypothetical protein
MREDGKKEMPKGPRNRSAAGFLVFQNKSRSLN